jgi:hypothetical protein
MTHSEVEIDDAVVAINIRRWGHQSRTIQTLFGRFCMINCFTRQLLASDAMYDFRPQTEYSGWPLTSTDTLRLFPSRVLLVG